MGSRNPISGLKQRAAPVHLLLHVGGVAVAVVGQQQSSVTQPVDVDLDVGGVHDQDVGGGGLAGHLGTGSEVRGQGSEVVSRGGTEE